MSRRCKIRSHWLRKLPLSWQIMTRINWGKKLHNSTWIVCWSGRVITHFYINAYSPNGEPDKLHVMEHHFELMVFISIVPFVYSLNFAFAYQYGTLYNGKMPLRESYNRIICGCNQLVWFSSWARLTRSMACQLLECADCLCECISCICCVFFSAFHHVTNDCVRLLYYWMLNDRFQTPISIGMLKMHQRAWVNFKSPNSKKIVIM